MTILRGVGWFVREFPLWLLTSVRDVALAVIGAVTVAVVGLVCWGAFIGVVGVASWLLFHP